MESEARIEVDTPGRGKVAREGVSGALVCLIS